MNRNQIKCIKRFKRFGLTLDGIFWLKTCIYFVKLEFFRVCTFKTLFMRASLSKERKEVSNIFVTQI